MRHLILRADGAARHLDCESMHGLSSVLAGVRVPQKRERITRRRTLDRYMCASVRQVPIALLALLPLIAMKLLVGGRCVPSTLLFAPLSPSFLPHAGLAFACSFATYTAGAAGTFPRRLMHHATVDRVGQMEDKLGETQVNERIGAGGDRRKQD